MADIWQRVADSFNAQGLMRTMGASLLKVEDGEVQLVLPFSKALSQQHGFMHAGAVTSIVDSAAGYAALTRAPEGYEVVTAEFKINLMRPAIGERFIAIGKVQNAGTMLTVCTGEVHAYTAGSDLPKVVALLQATVVNVKY
ncbi:MAG: PaaI family thioesterase [Comamonas sp.]